jgi:hypothetical protein
MNILMLIVNTFNNTDMFKMLLKITAILLYSCAGVIASVAFAPSGMLFPCLLALGISTYIIFE